MWKTIDTGIDIGLRYALPNYIEDEIIELKDNLINYGLKDGIKKTIESVLDIGKGIVGIFNGNFENVSQIQRVVKNGGVLDSISDLLDDVIQKLGNKKGINSTILKSVKKGKNTILDSVENSIEATLNNQIQKEKNLEKYMENWKNYYNNKDIDGMNKEINKIEKELKELVPIENTIAEARKIEHLHNLIINKDENFNITKDEQELLEKFGSI